MALSGAFSSAYGESGSPMTYVITKEIEFDAGHRVPQHESKCRNPHGHRYKVVAHLTSATLQRTGSTTGMVEDFGTLKQALTELVHDKYDHGFIVSQDDARMHEALATRSVGGVAQEAWKVIVVDREPTAENLARWIFYDLKPRFPSLSRIDVHETPTSVASYMEGS